MTNEEIKSKVVSIVAHQISEEEATINTAYDLRNMYGADSLDVVSIVMDVEKAFSISITDAAAEGIKTTDDIINEVKRNVLD